MRDPTVPKLLDFGQESAAQMALAKQLLRDGQYAAALEELQHRLNDQPDAPHTQLLLGVALFKLGRLEEARAVLGEAVRASDASAGAWLALAQVERELEEPESARSSALRAVALDAENAQAHLLLGQIERELGLFSEAVDSFRRALEEQGSWRAARRELCRALVDAGRREEAERELELARRSDPSDAEVCLALGDLLLERGEVQRAALEFKAAGALDPRQMAVSQRKLAETCLAQGWQAEAVVALKVALRADPQDVPTHLILARVLSTQGRRGEALERCRAAVALAPESAEALELLADLLAPGSSPPSG
jgi:predicted Zn-dependent protease